MLVLARAIRQLSEIKVMKIGEEIKVSQFVDDIRVYISDSITNQDFWKSIWKHFIVLAAKLNQHVYYKGIMTSKFGSKDMLLWKKKGSFVFTEDENLRIASRPIWLDEPRHPERLP